MFGIDDCAYIRKRVLGFRWLTAIQVSDPFRHQGEHSLARSVVR